MKNTSILANASRRLATMFPGYFESNTKHNHQRDFGYPEHLTFAHCYAMYHRNGIAAAGVDKTIGKTWESAPSLRETKEVDEETTVEADIRKKFAKLRFWQKLAEADRYACAGGYSGLILRLADNGRFNDPVETVAGLDALVEAIPAWRGQLKVIEWHDDESSDDYGKPRMFQYDEAGMGGDQSTRRSFAVHPDRVVVWSENGTVHARSVLEAGYNALVDLEKIRGAGGEGFWKNAKSAPVLNLDKEARIDQLAAMFGVPVEELPDKMDKVVGDYSKGFDATLMLQGIDAKTLPVTLPQPEEFRAGPLQEFAASLGVPLKILVGNQNGERASTEDAREWAKTCMARRERETLPMIEEIIERFVRFRILPERDWQIDWADLTESSMDEKIGRVDKMSTTNERMLRGCDEIVFTSDEMREAVGMKPLTDAESMGPDPLDAL